MTKSRDRSHRLRAVTGVATVGLMLAVAACGGSSGGAAPAASIGPNGTDDGAKLTLWTRAPLEKQAKLLVAAYNSSHKNQVALTVVPNDDYVAKVGAAAGAKGLPDLFAADIVYVPNWVNQGHLAAGTADGKEHVLPFVLDLSMLFWNKQLFKEAGLDPEKAPATLAEFAADAKKIQALKKPGVYGTATGFNCGGCLVFTWFPSVWASGQQVMDTAGTTSMLNGDTPKAIYSTWRDLWKSGAVLPSSKDEAGPTWTAGFTEGK